MIFDDKKYMEQIDDDEVLFWVVGKKPASWTAVGEHNDRILVY